MNAHDEIDEKLLAVGHSVARLSRPAAPEGLAARTLARVASATRRRIWILRPITNPFARIAAAAAILMVVLPLSDLEFAQNVGTGIEQRVGGRMVDRVEMLMDDVLPRGAPDGYSQTELDAFNNVSGTNKNAVRQVKVSKPRRV